MEFRTLICSLISLEIEMTSLIGNWRILENPKLGFLDIISSKIGSLCALNPDYIPRIAEADSLLVASDYSGQHKQSRYDVFAFLVTGIGRLDQWFLAREEVRRRLQGRRISYKSLGDGIRRRALPYVLRSGDMIPGLLFTVAVDKRLFHQSWKDFPVLEPVSDWTNTTKRKLIQILSFLALLIAGMSRANQTVYWFSDEDDIIPNDTRIYDIEEKFEDLGSHFITHKVHLKYGTARSDVAFQIEDLLSLPDLSAGCLGEVTNKYGSDINRVVEPLLSPLPNNVSGRARAMARWLSADEYHLRKLNLVLIRNEDVGMTLKWMKFHAQVF